MLFELLKETGVPAEFFAVPAAGHAAAVRHPEAMRLAMEFAGRYLKPEAAEDDDSAGHETEVVTADGQ